MTDDRLGLTTVRALHEEGRRANTDLRPTAAERTLRRALRLLALAPEADDALEGRIHVTLALSVAELGRTEEAHSLLDRAQALLGEEGAAVVHGQRAIVLRRSGRDDLALLEYDAALASVDPRSEPVDAARILLNRAVLHLAAGRPASARADLHRSAELAESAGARRIAVKAVHDLALLDLLGNDVPSALRRFEDVERTYAVELPGLLPTLTLDRGRALMSVGLVADAERDLAVAADGLRRQRVTQDLGEALLGRAECLLAMGDPLTARREARRAGRVFTARGNPRWAARAQFVIARTLTSPDSTGTVRAAARATATFAALGERFAELGLQEEACRAAYEQVLAQPAAPAVQVPTPPRTARPDIRLAWRLARAEIDLQAGRRGSGLAELRAGLRTLDAARARLGAPDLRTGSAALGRELAARGVRSAVDRGRPTEVFAWAERSRAQALRHPSVTPPPDAHRAGLLTELRSVRAALTVTGLGGRDAELRRRATALERELTRWHWETDGQRETGAAVRLDGVRTLLGPDAALLEVIDVQGALHALVVTDHVVGLRALGPTTTVLDACRRVRSSLDVVAGRGMPRRLQDAVRQVLRHESERVGAAVLGPVLADVGSRDLVVVASGELAMVPWAIVPQTRGRAVTVAPSATVWAEGVPVATPATGRTGALLVEGPRLHRAGAELAEVAAVLPGSTSLLGSDARVSEVLALLPQVAIAHFAAHGSHNRDHPAFSGIELVDGPLMGHDLTHLQSLPNLVVLSACDLGRHEMRPGQESLGMTTSFLAAGTRTVVAGVCRAEDADAGLLMPAFHTAVCSGLGPAAALAEAGARTGLDHPFVCFGHGGGPSQPANGGDVNEQVLTRPAQQTAP